MNSRDRLISKYEALIDEEEFSDEKRGISIPLLWGVIAALKEGMGPEHFEEERDINMQHMDQAYFRRVRWSWDRAIRATKHDLEKGTQA